MKEDRFEKFIRDHRDDFDIHSPSPEIWGSLNKQMHNQNSKFRMSLGWIKVAAVICIVLLSSGVFIINFISHNQRLSLAEDADPQIHELIEAEAYYAQQVNGKLKEIRKCYELIPELQLEVENDLLELESMYNSLKTDLKENISNKEVIEAMIENNRYRMKLVDDVLEQINC